MAQPMAVAAPAALTAPAGNSNSHEDEEEFWPAPSLLTGHKIHTIRFGGGNANSNTNAENEPTVLRYKSMSSEELTPLDMIYGSSHKNNGSNSNAAATEHDETNAGANANADDTANVNANVNANGNTFHDDEFYDGTGNLMWMAAVCFGHLIAQEVEPLRSYLFHGSPTPTPTPTRTANTKPNQRRRRFCELGCGTGGAGITLLLCAPSSTKAIVHKDTNDNEKETSSGCHLVFTDNDAESLELCASNCELNHLDPDTYSQRLLGWGSEHLEALATQSQTQSQSRSQSKEGGIGLEPYSFDIVLATDVVYDLKMIAPLFQTVDGLLKKKRPPPHGTSEGEDEDEDDGSGGHLILSHVPRFCIPQQKNEGSSNTTNDHHRSVKKDGDDDSDGGDDDDDDSPGEAFLELERFIQSEANKAGLVLTETIRPHQVLSEKGLDNVYEDEDENENEHETNNETINDDDSMQRLTLETMKEAHAVVFVFRRS